MHSTYRIALIGIACFFALLIGWGIASFSNRGTPLVAAYQPPPTTQAQAPTTQSQATTAANAVTELSTTAEPTITTSPEPTAAPTAIVAVNMREYVTQIMAPLQTGQLTAQVNYSDGTLARADAVFDLGAADAIPSVLMLSKYESQSNTQLTQRMMVGEQTWQRSAESAWVLVTEPNHMLHEVQVLLPNAATIDASERVEDAFQLRWYDAGQDTDVTLLIDSDSKLPYEMRQSFRATGLVRTIHYQNWNEAVTINPPVE